MFGMGEATSNNNNNNLFDQKIHSKQNTLYALSVKNVISQEMEKR